VKGNAMTLLSPAPVAAAGIDRRTFRQVFGRHPGGVVVVTADAGHGPAGLTLTSMTSVAADPPLLSFGISHGGSTWPTFAIARTGLVHFLDAGQADLARRFATSGIDRFARPTQWSRTTDGHPRLDEAPSYLRADVEQRVTAGDHDILIARVVEAVVKRDHQPLVHHAGAYRTTTDLGVTA
jgi:flavin reductase (DIM6/NTAB) family NADH-FMN oxidoreductase RutF